MPQPQYQEKAPDARRPHHLREAAGVAAVIPQRLGTLPQPQPDFAVNYREKLHQIVFQKGRVGEYALLQLAQDIDQTAPDVGSLPPSQLLGVKGVEQLALDAPVAVDGPQARRHHTHQCRRLQRLQFLKVRKRVCLVWSTQGLMEAVENGGRHFPALQIRTNDLCQPKFMRPLKILIDIIRTPVVPALRRLKYDAGHSIQKDIEDGAVVRMKA
jgi:hypothetical protein